MRCYICDRILEDDQVQFNEDHKDFDPCQPCLTVIEDLFKDRTVIEEDELDFGSLLGLFPSVDDPVEGVEFT